MDKIFDFIKSLSENDPKSLSAKGLKATEECGELAKVILPYDNAFGTNHRFSTKEKILEESTDLILTALSVGYSVGCTHSEFLEMLEKKSMYWAELQAREKKLKYPIPFEIHVTVERGVHIQVFKDLCAEIGVKPLALNLETREVGRTLIDVMTSSKFFGDNRGAYEETKRISNFLKSKGLRVLREKIETIPFHPAAPSLKDSRTVMPENCYFESHVSVFITPERTKEKLTEIAKSHNAHLSSNFFKKISETEFVNMITLRSYDLAYEEFMFSLESLLLSLDANKYKYEKVITEFSIYDTKISHDFLWINNKQEA